MTDKELERFDKHHMPEPNTGCDLWFGSRNSKGYGQFCLRGKVVRAHRAIFEHHYGPLLPGECVLHKCDVPECVGYDHLWRGTQADNIADRDAKGRQVTPRGAANGSRLHPERLARGDANGSRTKPERLARGMANGKYTHPEKTPRGEAHNNAKLVDAQVIEMRVRYAAGGVSHRALALEYGVSKRLVGKIINYKIWRHVP